MQQLPAVVATDLDGTIVRSDGTLSDRTVAALARVERSGATLVFVTGRPPRWLPDVVERTGHRGLAICANGALVYDVRAERIVQRHLLGVDTALRVVAAVRDALPAARFAMERDMTLGIEPGYPTREPLGPDVLVAPVAELFDQPVAKLLVRHPGLSADELLAAGRAAVPAGVAELTHSSLDGVLEISASGVSKASTLALLCAEHGIGPADVVAFGDMPNDLPMLAWAGVGYAVANAHPRVLAAAPRTCAANDDDGVARVLEALFAAPAGPGYSAGGAPPPAFPAAGPPAGTGHPVAGAPAGAQTSSW